MNPSIVFSKKAYIKKNDGNKVRGKISKSQYRPNQAKLINGKAYPRKNKMNRVERRLKQRLETPTPLSHFCEFFEL